VGTTIKDVAERAGVSVATVSRALNGHPSVTAAARERVQQAAVALHYMPHGAARSLSTRRTDSIGVLLPDLHGEFFSELIRGIDAGARARGLHLLVSSSHGDAAEAAAALRSMQGRVDGLLLMSPYVDAGMLANNLPRGFPLVLMNSVISEADCSAVLIDNYGGAYGMVRYLVASGYRRIAFVTGPEDNLDARARLQGYRNAMAELCPDQDELVLHGDFTEEGGYRAGKQILALQIRPDVIFAANDIMAIGCLFALTQSGVAVPRTMAVVGFDDIPIARYITPALTTVRVRIADLGGRALQRLLATVDQHEGSRVTTETMQPELVVRASCGMHGRNAGSLRPAAPDGTTGNHSPTGPEDRTKPAAAKLRTSRTTPTNPT
jgi:LacI family transcriptional regulator